MISRLKNYLSITKAQWNGLVVFLLLITLIMALPFVWRYFYPPQAMDVKGFKRDVALLRKAIREEVPLINKNKAGATPPQPYYTTNKLPPGESIELNTADSAMLTRIRGIGPVFAARIVAYRKRLGGFINKQQLQEVYGIDDERYPGIAEQVTVDDKHIDKINVNNVDFETLRRFPYLSYKQANAVIQYRLQHGNYHSISDLKNIAILDAVILRKIEPYISFK